MTQTMNVLDYIRILMFPLCALGFITSAIYEYQNSRSKLRLAIMLFTALSMLIWMVLTVATHYNSALADSLRHFAVTPVITILTVLIWSYALVRSHLCNKAVKELEKGGCSDGEVQ